MWNFATVRKMIAFGCEFHGEGCHLTQLPFDARGVQGTSHRDLDLRRFKLDYLPRAVSRSVLEQSNRSIDQQLAALKLLDADGRATPTGLLVEGVDPLIWLPGAYIQFLRVLGSDDTVGDTRISGTIDVAARVVEEKLAARNMTSQPKIRFRRRHIDSPPGGH